MTGTVIAGAGGMLGFAFAEQLGVTAVALHRDALDVARIAAIDAAIARSGAQVVINCAAHTDVEGAEAQPDDAWRVNALLPGILGTACRRHGAVLVHLSSTGAYGDWKDTPYDEEDQLRPTTVHHRSKAAGEMAVRDSGCEHLIVRTGWLFGGAPGQPKNFVWKRILEAASRPAMTSDASQTGNPTATTDVVRQTLATLAAGFRGTVNIVSQGQATRYDYVKRIISTAGIATEVTPTTTPFARAARVSPNEAAVNLRLQRLGLDMMPHWTEAVDCYVAMLTTLPEWRVLEGRS